jgi:signal peptide peptidase SppA
MNALRYAHVMSRLIDAPLWAHPLKAAVVYNALSGRLGVEPMQLPDDPLVERFSAPRPQGSRFVGEWPATQGERGRSRSVEPFKLTAGGVGVITITGALINRGAFVGSYSGETSYEGIKHQLARAAGDSRVKSILLDLDTPGGEANGAMEAAQTVREAASRKPVMAIANGMSASAGYALASGATRIITAPSAMVGSIGCVMVHLDISRALDREGVTPTLIVAGARKLDGNPVQPLSDEALRTLQTEVGRYYELFVETVAEGRGRRTSARAARETEGRIYVGREAVDARLADDVGTFEDVLGELTRHAGRPERSSPSTAPAATTRRRAMDPLFDDEGPAPIEAQPLRFPPEQIAQAQAAGAAAQIERFKAIAADTRVKGKEAFAMRLACEAPQMPADAVGAMCELTPAATARLSLAERSAETGAEAISSAPGPRADPAAAGWDTAINRTNARTQADTRRARA